MDKHIEFKVDKKYKSPLINPLNGCSRPYIAKDNLLFDIGIQGLKSGFVLRFFNHFYI